MNVKKGDMAIVINGGKIPALLGRIVEVEFFIGEGEDRWACHSESPITVPDPFDRGVRLTHKFSIRDSDLRPVSGLDDDNVTDTEKEKDDVLEAA